MKGKNKYIVPLLVASVTASGAVATNFQQVESSAQVFAAAVDKNTAVTSDIVQILNFDKDVTIGNSFTLPSVVVPTSGTTVKYTVKKGSRVVKEFTHVTTASDETVVPSVQVKADLAGYYNITITAERNGVISTIANNLSVYVKSPTATITLPSNSEYVIPSTVATSQANFFIPMPGLKVDGEVLTAEEVREAAEAGKLTVQLTAPDSSVYELTLDDNNDYYAVAPEKLASAGTYSISYYYEDGVTRASLKGLQEFQAVANFDPSKINLDFSYLTSLPKTGKAGNKISLSQLKIFDASTGTTDTVNAHVKITVTHVKTGTVYPVDYTDYTFTPVQTGNYSISYEAEMGIFNKTTGEGNAVSIINITDSQAPSAKLTYAYTTDTNTQNMTYGLVSGIYSAETGTGTPNIDGKYLEAVTYDVTNEGVIKSVTYKGETHKVDYTYADDNTTITHVNGVKFNSQEVFKLLMNRAVQNIVDGLFEDISASMPSVAQLKKDSAGNSSVEVTIPAFYAVDNVKNFDDVTYTRKLRTPSGQTITLKDGNDTEYAYNTTATYKFTTAGKYEVQYTVYDGTSTKQYEYEITIYDANSDKDLEANEYGKLGDGVTTINANIGTKSVSSEGTLIFKKPTATDTYDETLEVKTYLTVGYMKLAMGGGSVYENGASVVISEELDYVTYNSTSNEYSIDVAKALAAITTADGEDMSGVVDMKVRVEATVDSTLTGTRKSQTYNNGQVAVFDAGNSYTYYEKTIAVRNTDDTTPVEITSDFNDDLASLNQELIQNMINEEQVTGASADIDEYGYLDGSTNRAPFNQSSATNIKLPTVTFTDNDANLNLKVVVTNTNEFTGNESNITLTNVYKTKVTDNLNGTYTYEMYGAELNLAHSGIYTVTFIAEDIGGNITLQTFGIRVEDKTTPTIMITDSSKFSETWEAGKEFVVPDVTLQKYGKNINTEGWATYWEVTSVSEGAEFDLEVGNSFTPLKAGTYRISYFATYNGQIMAELIEVYSLSVKDTTAPTITVEGNQKDFVTSYDWKDTTQLVYFPIATAVDPNFEGDLDVTYTVTNASGDTVSNYEVDGDYIEYLDYYKIENDTYTAGGVNYTVDANTDRYNLTYTTVQGEATNTNYRYVQDGTDYYVVKTKVEGSVTSYYYTKGTTDIDIDEGTATFYYVQYVENATGEYAARETFKQVSENKDGEFVLVDDFGVEQKVDVDEYDRYVKTKDNTYLEAYMVRAFEAKKQGTYTIKYLATDGTNETPYTVEIKVGDVEAPKLEWTDSSKLITTMTKDGYWELPVDFIKLSDNVSSEDYLWDNVKVTLTAPDKTTVSNLGNSDNNYYKWQFTQTGDYTLQIVVKDESGKTFTSPSYKITVPSEEAKEDKVSPVVGTILIVLSVLVLAGVVTYFVVSNLRKGKKKPAKKAKKEETQE